MNAKKLHAFCFAAFILLIGAVHYAAFYRSMADHQFNSDAFAPFIEEVHSAGGLLHNLTSVDSLFEYRPIPYILFSFVLHPLFGSHAALYHAEAYVESLAIMLLACSLVYFWSDRRVSLLIPVAVFLALSPLNFPLSSGLEFLCERYSMLFYFAALLLFLRKPQAVFAQVFFFILALGSKEHSVVLPAHAALILISLGTSWREAFRRTRILWAVMLLFIAFQVAIRGGSLFPSVHQSNRLAFNGSPARLWSLVEHSEFLLSIPKRDWLPRTFGIHHIVRIAFFLPWAAALLVALKRKDRLAVAGALWVGISLLPVAFISEPPSGRHYLLALPGIAMLGARAVEEMQWAPALITPILVGCLWINVNYASNKAWFIEDAQISTEYMSGINWMAGQTGRFEVYATKRSAPRFLASIGRGVPLAEMLGKPIAVQSATEGAAVPVTEVLENEANLITARINGGVVDALEPGPDSILEAEPECEAVQELLGGGSTCTILSYGIQQAGSETANTIALSGEKILTSSAATTFFIDARDSVHFHRRAVLDRESQNGVYIEIYIRKDKVFRMIDHSYVQPGGVYDVAVDIDKGQADLAVLQIHGGAEQNTPGSVVEWDSPGPRNNQ